MDINDCSATLSPQKGFLRENHAFSLRNPFWGDKLFVVLIFVEMLAGLFFRRFVLEESQFIVFDSNVRASQ